MSKVTPLNAIRNLKEKTRKLNKRAMDYQKHCPFIHSLVSFKRCKLGFAISWQVDNSIDECITTLMKKHTFLLNIHGQLLGFKKHNMLLKVFMGVVTLTIATTNVTCA